MSLKGFVFYITHPIKFYGFLSNRGLLDWVSDETYLKIDYRITTKKKLNITSPKTFNEKLQWLKLHDRHPIYTTMVDKYAVKKYVADKIGKQYVIPLIGVWDKFEDIDFSTLPEQFVLKCNHDSGGGLVICKDKSKLDIADARKRINKSLKRNYYRGHREWPYKDVVPCIIAEKYMEDKNSFDTLNVYKIMTFNGEPKIIQAIKNDKTANESIDYFNTSWELLDLKQNFPNSEIPLSKPDTLDEMLGLAKELSRNTKFLRVDFYEVNGCVYFSEFTFYSDAGLAEFYPSDWNEKLGEWIEL